MDITVLYNKPTDIYLETETDTLFSVKKVVTALENIGLNATTFGVSKNDLTDIKNIKCDAIFNLIEWTGKDYQLGVKAVELLKKTNIPFTGSDDSGYELTCNKIRMKRLMEKYNIKTPNFQIFENGNILLNKQLRYPLIVKPAFEHCSIGLSSNSVVYNKFELKRQIEFVLETYNQPVVVEEFIDGTEVQVTILEKRGKPFILPPVEVRYRSQSSNSFLTYDAKWKEKSSDYVNSYLANATLSQSVFKKVNDIALKCFIKLGGRDYPRIDMRIKNEGVFVLEINNNPGISDDMESCIGFSSNAIGLDFNNLIKHILRNAMWRWKGNYAALAY